MKIEHVALWTSDLERCRRFYEEYFGAKAGSQYVNAAKGFASYFLAFESGARLEIMHRQNMEHGERDEHTGLAHFAVSAGSKEAVNELTEKIRSAGYVVESEPRTTGDGYYESVVLDPEHNRIEITV